MPTANRTSELSPTADIEAIREDLTSLKNDFSSLMSDIASGGKHVAQKGAESIAGTAKSAVDQVKSMHEGACDTIKSHPTASILVAAGIGAIAAKLFFSKGGR